MDIIAICAAQKAPLKDNYDNENGNKTSAVFHQNRHVVISVNDRIRKYSLVLYGFEALVVS